MKKLFYLLSVIIFTVGIIISLTGCDEAECAHQWGEWVTVEQPSCTKGGYRNRTCTVCGEIERNILYPSNHTYSDTWSFDGSYHWRAAICGHSDQTTEYARHTFDGNTCSICNTVKASQGLQYRGDLVSGTYVVVGMGTTLETDIVVAKYYNGSIIAAVGDGAFSSTAGLKSVWLQTYILTVGDRAFANSTDLTTVTITKGTLYLGKELFDGCTSLERVIFLGTKEQFNDIEKADGWDNGASGYVIECLDGVIEK